MSTRTPPARFARDEADGDWYRAAQAELPRREGAAARDVVAAYARRHQAAPSALSASMMPSMRHIAAVIKAGDAAMAPFTSRL